MSARRVWQNPVVAFVEEVLRFERPAYNLSSVCEMRRTPFNDKHKTVTLFFTRSPAEPRRLTGPRWLLPARMPAPFRNEKTWIVRENSAKEVSHPCC